LPQHQQPVRLAATLLGKPDNLADDQPVGMQDITTFARRFLSATAPA
jgi:hypothetical protein